jgi:hypothetical protein
MNRLLHAALLAAAALLLSAVVAGATAPGSDTLVTVGSPPSPFTQNKQNEPAVAVNPANPTIAAAGVNEEIDLEACNNRSDTTCPFTTGVGTSGIYFSDDSGSTWMQPTYSGWSARDCLGVPGTDPSNPADNCDPSVGPIGTLPRYYESGLVSDGDPAVGFGPQPDASGHFSWDNGWRLYYANLTANFSAVRSEQTFKGFEAIGISRLDSQNYEAAKAGDNDAWMAPVIATRQNAALFSDHEMVAADDAASSPNFGNVYVCSAAFRSQERGGLPEPIVLSASHNGGNTWRTTQLTPAVNNGQIGGRQDCAVDTDSHGVLYVFWDGIDPRTRTQAIFMTRSTDGGIHFLRPARVVTHIDPTGLLDPESGDFTFDGVAGARDGSFPTINVSNGAPGGDGATDEILLAWSNGPTPSDTGGGANEQVKVLYSTNRGNSWHDGGVASPASDRPDFPAIAISPDGTDAYLTYMNFLQPWQSTTADPRLMQGVVLHADVAPSGAIGAWDELNRGPTGDARGSSANALTDEFLGDYDYAFATNDFGVAVWNDSRDAVDCPAIDAYRQSLIDGTPGTRPAPEQDCPAGYGNTNIYGGSYADPTP